MVLLCRLAWLFMCGRYILVIKCLAPKSAHIAAKKLLAKLCSIFGEEVRRDSVVKDALICENICNVRGCRLWSQNYSR